MNCYFADSFLSDRFSSSHLSLSHCISPSSYFFTLFEVTFSARSGVIVYILYSISNTFDSTNKHRLLNRICYHTLIFTLRLHSFDFLST